MRVRALLRRYKIEASNAVQVGNVTIDKTGFTALLRFSGRHEMRDMHERLADTGAGISADDQIHVFERFYKADKARDRRLGGNGLGLSIVKKILDLHGFSITVDSEPGNGSRFTISLIPS